jgi:hypothetical protein
LTVTYDLHQPGRDYPAVEKLLESASGGYFHALGSVWFVDTLNDPAWWRDQLKVAGDSNDQHFVGRMRTGAGEWASWNMGAAANWLNDPIRRW